MKYTTCLAFLILSLHVCGDDTIRRESQGNKETACRNSYWNLEPLRRDDSDYESSEFTYLGLKWVVVFNFCRNTVRSCMWTHFSAFLNSRNRGFRCTPTLTSGDWSKAKFKLLQDNGVKTAKISWSSKIKGGFEMWISCNPETNYTFKKIDIKSSPWKMYMESKYVC